MLGISGPTWVNRFVSFRTYINIFLKFEIPTKILGSTFKCWFKSIRTSLIIYTLIFLMGSDFNTFLISIGMITLKRFDQCHLHSKLEVPRLSCPGWESNPSLPGGRRAL
jgi:hypothetical protein